MKYVIDVPPNYISHSHIYGNLLTIPYVVGGSARDFHTNICLEPYEENDREKIEKEVWEFAKTLDVGITIEELYSIFGDEDFYNNYTYKEAKKKYEEWKKPKEEVFCVGDEIEYFFGMKAIITFIKDTDDEISIIFKDGSTDCMMKSELKDWKKTGRHFPNIVELLEEMKE